MQKTIPQLWKKEFSQNKNNTFIWDNILWMQTKKDFIIKAYLISDYIKKIPWEKVGIMLPAVWSASLLLMATYLAWKTPVMFNWTLWKEAFNHCKNFSGVEKILTSSNFYDKVKNVFLEEHQKNNEFTFVEELLKNITTIEKIKALIKSFYMPVGNAAMHSNDIAVILFTSWSESLPKAVPLTHENLIENIKWALELFCLGQDDKLLGFLPPFHSFWFTINTITPLITGLQTVYTPDPNDAKTILNIIKHTKITTITSTPTFLKMIMSLATKEDFKTIKYVAVWAEKCSHDVFNKFKELCPKWVILEWYGITECSPVVSINPLEKQIPWSVWKVISCLDCKIIKVGNENLRSMEEMPVWEQWMIYVKWKSIFTWYLDDAIESPFEEITVGNENFHSENINPEHNKKYYKTWDLWFLNKDWYLSITWRLKRFIKIAWEMISLPFVEGVLLEKYWNQEVLQIAIEALEKEWNAKIVLFSIEHIELEEVNDYMRKRWVSNLVKISEIIKVAEIPVLWTWKTDYKILKGMIK